MLKSERWIFLLPEYPSEPDWNVSSMQHTALSIAKERELDCLIGGQALHNFSQYSREWDSRYREWDSRSWESHFVELS